MPVAEFDVLLEQPTIVSQHSATSGAHTSLDYLPGSVFLGLAASKLYAKLTSDQAWQAFHSGELRFGDALPVKGGETGYPVPLSLHYAKGTAPGSSSRLSQERLFDPSQLPEQPTEQPVQLRSGYITPSGGRILPVLGQSMKTAIDRQTAMAADSQLFGYQHIQAGQRYRFRLESDDSVPTSLMGQVVDVLSGSASLGRSRSAQYGAAMIRPVTTPYPREPSEEDSMQLTLWLLSDLQLLDRGQPTLLPLPELIGLPSGSEWLPGQSFLRPRRYSSWNARRRSHNPENHVIGRGAVLRFRLHKPLDSTTRAALESGIGLQIELGLGRVWINPPMLIDAKPTFCAPPADVLERSQPLEPKSLLLRRLRHRAGLVTHTRDHRAETERLFIRLADMMDQARAWHAVPAGMPLEPSLKRSQWAHLKQLSSDYRGHSDALLSALANTENGVLRPRSGWELRLGPEQENTLGNWLLTQLRALAEAGHPIDQITGQLAVTCMTPRWDQVCEGLREAKP